MKNRAKKIQRMFSSISDKYDFLNHFLSFGMDILWRKKVANVIHSKNISKIADIACGTGDLAIEIYKKNPKLIIIGIDFCYEMLDIARKKTKKITFVNGDATSLPCPENSFDCVTIAFGIRNIPLRNQALQEFYGILKKDGYLMILEFDIPDNFLFKFYFKKILPVIGGFFSSKEAYEYLPDSVTKFPRANNFIKEIQAQGFDVEQVASLSFGTVKLYICRKP